MMEFYFKGLLPIIYKFLYAMTIYYPDNNKNSILISLFKYSTLMKYNKFNNIIFKLLLFRNSPKSFASTITQKYYK